MAKVPTLRARAKENHELNHGGSENARMKRTTLEENPGTDIQEAEEIAYDELKPKYLSVFVSRYKYVVELSAVLKKDPVNKRIASTAKRLREEEDYDEDESREYAIKKLKFLIEKKMGSCDPPSYEKAEEDITFLPYRTISNKPMGSFV